MEQEVHFEVDFDNNDLPQDIDWVPNEIETHSVFDSNGEDDQQLTVRLDKWLWAARFFKTRALARAAVEKGKVLYNGYKSKASKEIALGDKVKIKQGKFSKEIVIIGLSTRRRNAEEAQSLYKEIGSHEEIEVTAPKRANSGYRHRRPKVHAATPFMPTSSPMQARRIEVRGSKTAPIRFLRRTNGKSGYLHTNSYYLYANDE